MSDHCVLNFTCNLHIDETKSEDKFNFDKGDCAQLSEFSNVNWGSIVDHSAISFHIVFYPEHVFSSILISYNTTKVVGISVQLDDDFWEKNITT